MASKNSKRRKWAERQEESHEEEGSGQGGCPGRKWKDRVVCGGHLLEFGSH